ncbi:MAG: bifunctional DNA-formamidopyrimidine glycosylase/DNA-(apurinic or apyrimidinic site) lyase [Patescibacteria group bacterium]|nr:bifunctional DNA-formamidopyrimidine glycosylase/DNA-(apurinic or apyrimidinic site) lyase [Patescibacteria group bacterium]
MPELPEVTTTVKGLKKLTGETISGVWTDLNKKNQKHKAFINTIKDDKFYQKFKKEIAGQKIIKVKRKAKNILIELSNGKIILIHLKMTGHLLYGKYIFKNNQWKPHKNEKEELHDPFNRFIHTVFSLKNGKHLVFCDARKFGKVTLIQNEKELDLGPEPLEKSFTFEKFKKQLNKKGKIKTVLMNQKVIAGIGNIYSDEILWKAGVHPESISKKIKNKELKKMFIEMKEILKKGIELQGDSTSDYRNIDGEKGNFQKHHHAYRKTKDTCDKRGCSGIIKRKEVGNRNAHFCNKHQKLYV